MHLLFLLLLASLLSVQGLETFKIVDQLRQTELPQAHTQVLFLFRLEKPRTDDDGNVLAVSDVSPVTHLRLRTPAGFYTSDQCRTNVTTQFHLVFDVSPSSQILASDYAPLPILDDSFCNATFLGKSTRKAAYRSQPGEGQRQEILLELGDAAVSPGVVVSRPWRWPPSSANGLDGGQGRVLSEELSGEDDPRDEQGAAAPGRGLAVATVSLKRTKLYPILLSAINPVELPPRSMELFELEVVDKSGGTTRTLLMF